MQVLSQVSMLSLPHWIYVIDVPVEVRKTVRGLGRGVFKIEE